jgi:hypothetical protein
MQWHDCIALGGSRTSFSVEAFDSRNNDMRILTALLNALIVIAAWSIAPCGSTSISRADPGTAPAPPFELEITDHGQTWDVTYRTENPVMYFYVPFEDQRMHLVSTTFSIEDSFGGLVGTALQGGPAAAYLDHLATQLDVDPYDSAPYLKASLAFLEDPAPTGLEILTNSLPSNELPPSFNVEIIVELATSPRPWDINVETITATFVAHHDSAPQNPVPEPCAAALALIGAGCILFCTRCQLRASAKNRLSHIPHVTHSGWFR